MGEKVLIVIPAKGTSRRLPGKSLLQIGGRSLVEIAAERAVTSKIGEVVVSTESDLVYDVLRTSNVGSFIDVIKRPQSLCGDDIRVWEVLVDVLNFYEGEGYTTVMMTLPTSPFCLPTHMIAAYEMFFNNGRKPVMSVTKVDFNPNTLMEKYFGDNTLVPLRGSVNWKPSLVKAGQDKVIYKSNGAVWICDVAELREKKEQYIDGMLGYEMGKVTGLDIDTDLDFLLAKTIWEMGNESIANQPSC